jgi:hypothetical protein
MEDRIAEGIRDKTGSGIRTCSGLLTRLSDTGRNSTGQPPVGKAKMRVDRPRQEPDVTSERRCNDS